MKQLVGLRKGKSELTLAIFGDGDTWSIQGEWIVIENAGQFVSAYRIFHDVRQIIERPVTDKPIEFDSEPLHIHPISPDGTFLKEGLV